MLNKLIMLPMSSSRSLSLQLWQCNGLCLHHAAAHTYNITRVLNHSMGDFTLGQRPTVIPEASPQGRITEYSIGCPMQKGRSMTVHT